MNKQHKFEEFLQAGTDLALFRRLRKLYFEQRPEKIQIYDIYDQLLMLNNELHQIQEYFGQLCHNPAFQMPSIHPIQ